jgi:hypothetical protein
VGQYLALSLQLPNALTELVQAEALPHHYRRQKVETVALSSLIHRVEQPPLKPLITQARPKPGQYLQALHLQLSI